MNVESPAAYAAHLQTAARERTSAGWTLPESTIVPREIRRVGVIGAGVMGSALRNGARPAVTMWCCAM